MQWTFSIFKTGTSNKDIDGICILFQIETSDRLKYSVYFLLIDFLLNPKEIKV